MNPNANREDRPTCCKNRVVIFIYTSFSVDSGLPLKKKKKLFIKL